MGIVMFIIGLICKKLHDDYEEYPDIFVGYKLKYAMRNEETWEEANNYILKPCIFVFIFSIIFTLIIRFFNLDISGLEYFLVGMFIISIPVICTEIHIRRFNKSKKN